MKEISDRIPNEKLLHHESHHSAILALKLLFGDRSQFLRDATNELLNTHNIIPYKNDTFLYIVYILFRTLQITFSSITLPIRVA